MAASEARSLGYGGVSRIRRACGLSRKAIAKGIREIADGNTMPRRIRRSGAGRKNIIVRDPKLLASLERLIEPETRGDPESPLRWICKSTRTLAAQLTGQKHPVSHEKVAQLLRDQNYSLQSNRKTEKSADHPDRDAQYRHINAQVKRALATEVPVVACQDWLPNLAKFSFANPASHDARRCLIRFLPSHPFIRTRLHVSEEGSSRYRSAESITFSFLTVALTIER